MELFRCDACKRDTKKYGLNELNEELKTENIKQLCDECMEDVKYCWLDFQVYLHKKIKVSFCKRIIQRLIK